MRGLQVFACVLLALPAAQAGDLAKQVKRALAQAGDDPQAQVAAIEPLAQRDSEEACALLAELTLHPKLGWQARDAARGALLGQAGVQALAWAGDAARSAKDPRARALACQLLGRLSGADARALPALLGALDDDASVVRLAAVAALSSVREPQVVGALVRCLASAEGRLADDCRLALQGLTGERHADAAAWTAWWEAQGDGYVVPDEATSAQAAPPAPRSRTVTRLDQPAGRTVFEDVRSSRVVFVVDVSYSMRVRVLGGDQPMTRLEYVQAELRRTLEELDDADRFNLVAFSADVKLWKKKLTKADRRGKGSALKWLAALRPDADTNIHDALEVAFLHDDVDTIYFLTDGNPTAGALTVNDEILAAVRAWNAGRNVRVHTVAFLAGDAEAFQVVENKGMATRFLEALASENQGTFSLFE